MNAEALYAQLKELADSEPAFDPPSADSARWLGRLHHIVRTVSGGADAIAVKVASDNLTGALAGTNIQTIRNALYRALAVVEREMPEAAQGGFIAAGDVFDALAVMGTALEAAKERVLFVDPYLGTEVLSKYAVMVAEGVKVDLLCALDRMKPALLPAAQAWVEQYGAKRPLQLRLVDKALLHDRLLLVDDRDAWDISQSLNAIAKRTPATIARARSEQAAMKVEAYTGLFDQGQALI